MRKKPSKEELIETLEAIPKFSSSDPKMFFQALVGEYPEITLFSNFEKIFTPKKSLEQMADEILAREKRRKERGFGGINRLLLRVDKFLFNPGKVIRAHRAKISKETLSSLLRITFSLQNNGLSVDRFFDNHGYSDNVKRLVAEGFTSLYEVGIMFREELYKDYQQKGKTIEKMPETGPYFKDVIRFNVGGRKLRQGKKPARKTINEDIESFRAYLLRGNFKGKRNMAFYGKRFRYIAHLIIGMSSIIDVHMDEEDKNKVLNPPPVKKPSSFSIDKAINDTVWKPRNLHGISPITVPTPIVSSTGPSI
jgi:hypothetical protein